MFKVRFKHEDTRWLLFLVLIYCGVVTVAWVWLGEGAVYIALGAVLVMLLGMQMHLYRRRQDDDVRFLEHVQDLFALYTLVQPTAPLPALTRWSATPALASTLASLVLTHRPRRVVEFGSGASTLVLALALERLGEGHVTAVEHDARYADTTRKALARHGLGHRATVVHAPLGPVTLDGETRTWYDPAALDDLGEVGMVVVDGPPADTGLLARYPALPLLKSRLVAPGLVVLHDAHRPDEQQVLARWQAECPHLQADLLPTPKGIGVLRLRDDAGGSSAV
ncbi:hypothetical protein AWN76_012630 [Rhodothermaceae bacterium RA]|nr:hypothetical protein AWN76_012630 [Rhodothermaceae bacterium RA]